MKLLFACISLLLATFVLNAQTLEATKSYADYHFQNGNYELALEDYSRVAFFQREDPDFETIFKIAQCYAQLEEGELAERFVKQAYFLSVSEVQKNEASIHLVQLYLRNGAYSLALEELLATHWTSDIEMTQRANFYLGITYYFLENYDAAYDHFLKTQLDSATIHYHLKQQKKHLRPHVEVATWMSVLLPGLGQAYTGHYSDAVNSFALNGIFWAITLNSYSSIGLLEGFIVVAPWLQRYYVGGAYNARKLAREKQASNKDAVLQQLLEAL